MQVVVAVKLTMFISFEELEKTAVNYQEYQEEMFLDTEKRT